MIQEVTGDILLSKAKMIAHGVAPNDNFNQGLALALRENWPAMYKDFRHYTHQSRPECGEIWVWAGTHGRIANLFTQEPAKTDNAHPGKATLSHVNHCLKNLKKEIEANNIESVALPKIATGVGGLSWNEVFPLIQETLGALKIPVYVYSNYKPGVPALEKA